MNDERGHIVEFKHTPVLLEEVIEYLNPKPGQILVDGTLGGAGHSKVLLSRIIPGGRLIGLDRDLDALQAAHEVLSPFGVKNFTLIHSNFARMDQVLQEIAVEKVDGILLDLGVSSYQLDNAQRGFSYQHDAPLDMRMDRSQSFTAQDLVNNADQEELSKIIWKYGEERWSKRIAQFIVKERDHKVINTTGELVEVIKKAIPSGARREGPHPAKRTFQALRIAVNGELEILQNAFEKAVDCLGTGGRLAVITFHSLEDRITKKTFQGLAKGCICPKDLPTCVCNQQPLVRIITNKPLGPGEEELEKNPRSRSAKLRVVEKLAGSKEKVR